jgi:hypothetical protein
VRLLEALERGKLTYKEQNFGSSQSYDGSKGCVNRTLNEGAGAVLGTHIATTFPILTLKAKCPECERENQLYAINVHLNDLHRWTREQIVYWDSQFEPEQVDEYKNAEKSSDCKEGEVLCEVQG